MKQTARRQDDGREAHGRGCLRPRARQHISTHLAAGAISDGEIWSRSVRVARAGAAETEEPRTRRYAFALPRMQKRAREETATLSVFSYNGFLATHFIERVDKPHALLLTAIFGPKLPHSVFSITSDEDGDFLCMDTARYAELVGGGASQPDSWACLYLHEESSQRAGAEISGTLSRLCGTLASAAVPVLNLCTLARNFMLVRQEHATRALATLRSAVESGGAAAEPPPPPPPSVGLAANPAAGARSDVKLSLLPCVVTIASLSEVGLKESAHALLHLLFFQSERPRFFSFFEMAGEASLMVDEAALAALRESEPASAASLFGAIGEGLSAGWRVVCVTQSKGSDRVGVLSEVCLPLASLPLMNVSTGSKTFVLVPGRFLDRALELLAPRFVVELPGST